MIMDETIKNWDGSTISVKVEDRYSDSGEILLHLEDGMDAYTSSLILVDLIELRDKINKAIGICKKIDKELPE